MIFRFCRLWDFVLQYLEHVQKYLFPPLVHLFWEYFLEHVKSNRDTRVMIQTDAYTGESKLGAV